MNVLARKIEPYGSSSYDAVFAKDVIAGLRSNPKYLAAKYFYDAAGSELFEQITELPEYYPTRTEIGILQSNAGAIAALLPKGGCLVEFGSGAATKARLVLASAPTLAAYVPVDISGDFLNQEARALRRDFPRLRIAPVTADFTRPFALPDDISALPRAGFFPGSTIGNFEPNHAVEFLRHAGEILGPGATFIVGVDLVKEPAILHAAYNDAAGITRAFNLNVLTRINRELGATFDLVGFEHDAFFNRERSRIEMHLTSVRRQRVRVGAEWIEFRAGETIHTENSYKYSVDSFLAMASASGWTRCAVWTDPDQLFAVVALTFGR